MSDAILTKISDIFVSLLQTFRLASVLPLLIFFCLNFLFIFPELPQTGFIVKISNSDISKQLTFALGLSLPTGMLLSMINVPLIRMLEGYYWLETWYGKHLIEVQHARKRLLTEKAQSQGEIVKTTLEQMVQTEFPSSRPPFLPTTLGNIIASFEDYAHNRYGIDAVVLWPRLLPSLSKEKYSIYVERQKTAFDFVVNLYFLLIVFAIETAFVGLIFSDDFILWMIVSLTLLLVIHITLYNVAILGAASWGMTVRVAFDLYRYSLLASLYGKGPDNYIDERIKWERLSAFLRDEMDKDIEWDPAKEERINKFMARTVDYSKVREYLKNADTSYNNKGGE